MSNVNYRDLLYARYVTTHTRTGCSRGTSDEPQPVPFIERLVRRHFPANRDVRILELGCGSGELIAYLHAQGYCHVTGVDTSTEQVALARGLGRETIEQADVFDALHQRPSSSLDVVVAFDVVEHLSKPEVLPLFEEVCRVVAPGGRFLIHTINGESPFFGRIRYGDFTHEVAFTSRSMRQLLLYAGFTRIDSYEDTPVVHGLTSFGRAFLWQVIRSALRIVLASTRDRLTAGPNGF